MSVLGLVVLENGSLASVTDSPEFVPGTATDIEIGTLIEKLRGLCITTTPQRNISHFITENKEKRFITTNVKKVYQAIKNTKDAECISAFVNAIDTGRVRDIKVLHSLITLATVGSKIDTKVKTRDLATRYGPFADFSGTKEEKCRILPQLYEQMSYIATELMDNYTDEFLDDVIHKFGYLTDIIQVKSIVALTELESAGIGVDATLLKTLTKRSQERANAALKRISEMPEFSDCCQKSENEEEPLLIIKEKCKTHIKTLLNINETQTSKKPVKLNTLCKCHRTENPFIAAYLGYCTEESHLNFLSSIIHNLVIDSADECTIHPHYDYLTRNGRTRAKEPNIQTTPTEMEYRSMFVPRKGCVFATLDYDYIELCTLAAICEMRYGDSVLARIIREGVDPHCFTAAMLLGVKLSEFMALGESENLDDRKRFREWRQKAKAVNFGIPSGWNPAAFRDHVVANFGVEMSLEEAVRFRDVVIRDIYPEMGLYLYENSIELLGRNLKCSYNDVWFNLWNRKRSVGVIIAIRNTIRGNITRKAGGTYSRDLVQLVWEGLLKLSARPEVDPVIHELAEQIVLFDKFDGSPLTPELDALHKEIYDRLFTSDCATITGRIRARSSFTKARNTPFSGLAADGAKLALFDIIFHGGYKVVGFVHDEFIVELPEEKGDLADEVERIKEMAVNAMTDATGGIVRISCKCKLASTWSK